ncbi:MAG TPA: hypothetical protein VHB98_00020 [Chloroflexota bacterium]|nr:hypothetical protein [Chloroflexota bacterium]
MADDHKRRRPAPARIGRWEQRMDRVVLALGRSPWGRSGYGRARGLLHIFHLANWLLERGHPSRALRSDGVVRYEFTTLPTRRALPLRGQPPVRYGEPIVGLHFDNRVIAALSTTLPDTRRLTWHMIRSAEKDMQQLADLARAGGVPPNIRAIWAETLIYPSLARYGYHTRPAPRSIRTPFARLFMLSLLAIYGRPEAGMSERAWQHLQLGEAWIGVEELKRRFPPLGAAQQQPESLVSVPDTRPPPAESG